MSDREAVDTVQPSLPARVSRAALGLLAALTVGGLVGTALSPVLLVESPLLLVALAPDGRHIALAAGRVEALPLIAVGAVRRSLFGLAAYGLGATYGGHALSWLEQRAPRWGKLLRVVERILARAGPLILVPLPFATVCVLAGAARTRFPLFLLAMALGHVLWVTAIYLLGARFSTASQVLTDFLSEHLLESTLICVALVLGQQLWSRRRAAPPAP